MKKQNALSAVCVSLDGPMSLQLEEVRCHPPGPNEVAIDVKAASLNFPDLLMTYGKYQFKPELPFVLGMEGAGIVRQAGPDVTRLKVGDRVMFKGKTGACGGYITVAEDAVDPLPDYLSFEEGAAFSVTFMTAYISLAKRGRLQAGETLLVHGSGGGVGQAAVAVGKALGATVIATGSSSDKLNIARQSGADHILNYKEASFSEQVMDLTSGAGADVILDPVGGDILDQSVACLAWGGRLLTVGFASGGFGNISLPLLQERGAALIGVRAGEYSRRDPVAGQLALKELTELAAIHQLRPWIGQEWSLEQISEALVAMERREVLGKQIININGGQ